jgi:hypothetical protein
MTSDDQANRRTYRFNRLDSRIGAFENLARNGSHETAARARRGFIAKFERQVDPDGLLDPLEREARALVAMRAHMLRLARKSAEVRRRKKAAE